MDAMFKKPRPVSREWVPLTIMTGVPLLMLGILDYGSFGSMLDELFSGAAPGSLRAWMVLGGCALLAVGITSSLPKSNE